MTERNMKNDGTKTTTKEDELETEADGAAGETEAGTNTESVIGTKKTCKKSQEA